MPPRNCCECGAKGMRDLGIKWRAYFTRYGQVRLCSLVCVVAWRKAHPDWRIENSEAFDEDAWVRVA